MPLRLKVEISTREHFTEYGLRQVPFGASSRWFTGAFNISTYRLDERLGAKLHALYQRRKGRDLFDTSTALMQGGHLAERVIRECLRCPHLVKIPKDLHNATDAKNTIGYNQAIIRVGIPA